MNKNNLSFGQRVGAAPIDIPFQVDTMDKTLRIELWNAYYIFVQSPIEKENTYNKTSFRFLNQVLWVHTFKKALDDFPQYDSGFRDYVRQYIDHSFWYLVYAFFEDVFKNLEEDQEVKYHEFVDYVNQKLRSNNSAYTFANGQFIPITNETEISELKKTQSLSRKYKLSGIQEHLNSAIELLSRKPNPEFRNSIKESISMVEVISRIIEPSENTLGKALKKLDEKSKINETLQAAFVKLYAYTNNKNGIRHALMEDENVDVGDAKFFLISCSAFTNYLIEKAIKDNLLKTD